MQIDELLYTINNKQDLIDNLNLSNIETLKLVPHFRLDWGSDEDDVSDEFNIGVTKPILLSRLSGPNNRLFQENILFQKSPLAQKLVDTFITNKTLSKDLLFHVHSQIIPNGGNLRTQEVIVSDQTYTTNTFFTNSEQLENQVLQLIEWYNKEIKSDELHSVIIAAVL